MICFPDLDSLGQALAAGLVPLPVRCAPAAVGLDLDHRLWLLPAVPLPLDARPGLRRHGAEFPSGCPNPLLEQVSCWHQLVPPVADALPEPGAEVPVLFEMEDPAQWPRLAAELRRLGRPGPSYQWNAEAEAGPTLVLVSGAPSLTLLTGQQAEDALPPWRCYLEQAPNVWVEVGYRQPLAEEIEPPRGLRLLISGSGCWTHVEDAPFQAELTALPLPTGWARASDGARPTLNRLSTPLGLTRVEKPDDAELWVLSDQPLAHLAALVRDADDDVVGRLSFAIAEREGRLIVVIRATAGRRRPPVLMVPAPGFRPYLKLPNLFLPCGYRLRPSLRRDAVRELLADDPGQIVWLFPGENGSFRWESVPAAEFRPLREGVEYVVPNAPRSPATWEPNGDFEFEPYAVAPEDTLLVLRLRTAANPPPSPPGTLDRLKGWWQRIRGSSNPDTPPLPAPPVPPPPIRVEQETPRPTPGPRRDRVAEAVHVLQGDGRQPANPAAEKPGLHALEQKFLGLDGTPDAPERQALWPDLAAVYTQKDNPTDAAVCWMNALWESADPQPIWWWGWFRAEAQAAHWFDVDADLRRAVEARPPEPADIRAVAAFCAWTACDDADAAEHANTLPPDRLRDFLETHEALLPARAAWLAWAGLSRRSGGDVLGLARARDRLLERLYHRGLSPERDLPGFLRFGGRGVPQRFPSLGGWLGYQRGRIDRWVEKVQAGQPREPTAQGPPVLVTESYFGKTAPYRPLPYGPAGDALLTKAYSDLVLAWGLARLGATSGHGTLIEQARDVLENLDPVHTFLFRAYVYRIDQALEGRHEGPLPVAFDEEWQRLGPQQRLRAEQLRRQSHILRPGERIDPYHGQVQHHYHGELGRQLAALAETRDRQDLGEQMRRLLHDARRADAPPTALPRVLRAALELAPRVGEGFARDVLAGVGPVLDELADVQEQAALLERGVFVAAHFDQAAYVEALVARFEDLLDTRRGTRAAAAFESLAAQSYRGLRKLGRRGTLERLLQQMSECLLQGQGLKKLRTQSGPSRALVLRSLLHVAAGWFYTGADEQATTILDEVCRLLYEENLNPNEQWLLARVYAATLGHAPIGLALERIEEMFARLDRIHDASQTRSFSLPQLDLVETVVIAVASDDFSLGASVRRWLDEEEYLVRRRIHRDLRALL